MLREWKTNTLRNIKKIISCAGINGLVKYSGIAKNYSMDSILNLMNKKLYHRGPDDKGVWVANNEIAGLGQVRLSILDLTNAGHQPMQEGGNIITFNGEIFNYRDINDDYFKNENFISNTDTETLLKLYKKFYTRMFSKLNGMFAFGLWDNQKQSLFLLEITQAKTIILYRDCW